MALGSMHGHQANANVSPHEMIPGTTGDDRRPPSVSNPIGGAAQMAWNMWAAYGPALMMTGATVMQSAAARAGPSSSSAYIPPTPPTPPGPSFPVPTVPDAHSNTYLPLSEDEEDAETSGKYEEIDADEGEGYSMAPHSDDATRRTSWWGWGSNPGQGGYERVKSD